MGFWNSKKPFAGLWRTSNGRFLDDYLQMILGSAIVGVTTMQIVGRPNVRAMRGHGLFLGGARHQTSRLSCGGSEFCG